MELELITFDSDMTVSERMTKFIEIHNIMEYHNRIEWRRRILEIIKESVKCQN